MKLSYNWLKDYIKCDLSAQQIADAMTSIGIEVDSVEETEVIEGGFYYWDGFYTCLHYKYIR